MSETNELNEKDNLDNLEIENEQVSAFLLDNGEIVDFQKAQQKSKGKNNKKQNTNTMDTDEDDWGEQYASGRVYRPTLNLVNLKQFSLENLYHARCIKQKAIDSCQGYDIVTVDRKGVPVKTIDSKRSTKDNKLYDFFEECTTMEEFMELAKQITIDFETFGFIALEMTRRRNGDPARFYHLPSETCRIARNLNLPTLGDTDQKYMVQVVNAHERIFKIFDGERPNVLEPHTKNPMTEVLIIRNYHVMGGKYGIPDWVPALKAMIGNDKVAEYNINFFNNEAVPRFAVVVQGGKLDDETKKDIKSYFKKDLKGVQNAHKTLVLTTPKGTEVKLIPLAVEMKDGGFRFYRKDNRDEIISGHGVPPHRIQVFDSGNSGSLSPGMLFDLDKAYKYSVIQPLQYKVAGIFNRVIRLAWGIKDKKVVFTPLDIGEEKMRAEILKTIATAHEKYYNIGSMTPDEIRVDNKQEKYSEQENCPPDLKEWASTPKPLYLLRQQQKLMQQQTQGDGVDMNSAGGNVNETANDFDEKSKEQTGNFDDKQMKQLLMKSAFDMQEVIQKVDSALSSISEISQKVEEHLEEGK